MLKATVAALVAALVAGAAATPPSICNTFHDCQSCLNPVTPDCGWCSPKAAVFANGSKAFQCMDHRSLGWTCFNLYMHDGCTAGWTCNSTSGQCIHAPKGQGDTKENCEKSCTAHPVQKQYSCNMTTLQCELAPTGEPQKETCASFCGNNTPSAMVGLWRGINVQTNFSVGSWVMNATEHEVAWGPLGSPREYVASVATLSRTTVRLTFSAPTAQAGRVAFASFSTPGWPTGPETRSMSIALQRASAHEAPPDNVANAMGDASFDVFVMHACNSWSSLCDFSPAFAAAPARRRLGASASASASASLSLAHSTRSDTAFLFGSDPCTAHDACDSCIHDPLRTCGWCDGIIHFHDGTTCGDDGNGCCGGDSGFSLCNVAYRRDCPVTCDWTNWTSPVCRSCTSKEIKDPTVQKFEDCDVVKQWHACEATWGKFCNTSSHQCQTVSSKAECEKTPGCDPENPQCASNCTSPSPSEKKYNYCDPDSGCKGPVNKTECESNPHCDPDHPQCFPEQCKATTYYVCDPAASYQCKVHTGPPPPGAITFNTSAACEKACYNPDLTGVWRGLRIDSGFVVDEYDFSFANGKSVTYRSKKSGTTETGTYTVGAALVADAFPSYEITITLASGGTFHGLYSDKDEGPITKFLYLGLPLTAGGAAVTSYTAAMAKSTQEFVLVACLPTIEGCDFSSAAPRL